MVVRETKEKFKKDIISAFQEVKFCVWRER